MVQVDYTRLIDSNGRGARARVADARRRARVTPARAPSRGRASSRARRRALSRQFVESTRGYGKAPIAVTVGRGDVTGTRRCSTCRRARAALIVPPALGYGEFGTQTYGGVIPPGARPPGLAPGTRRARAGGAGRARA